MRAFAFAITIAIGAASITAPASAQQSAGAIGPEDSEKVKQVFVYGDDPCPVGEGDEIVVCARMPDNDRYRIPKDLRTDPNAASVQSWANRARSFEYVGADGTESCSATGGGGFTGCFAKLARVAKEERKALLGSASWADAVAAERNKRLGNLDAESEALEQQAKQDEAEAAARQKAQEAARNNADLQDPARPVQGAVPLP